MGILKGVDSMKKTLAWVCLLALLFSFGATSENLLFDSKDYEGSIENNTQFSFAVANDKVYLFTYGNENGEERNGYSCVESPYNEKIEPYQFSLDVLGEAISVSDVYSDGENIWTWVNGEDFCVYQAVITDEKVTFEEKARFPFKEAVEGELSEPFFSNLMPFNQFYLGRTEIFDDSGIYNILVVYDTDEEEARVYEADDEYRFLNIVGMMPYTDETVLLASAVMTDEMGELVFYELNPEEHELTELAVVSLNMADESFGYAYDREKSELYFTQERSVYRITDMDVNSLEVVANLQIQYTGSAMGPMRQGFLTSDGHYITSDGVMLFCCSLTGSEEVTTENQEITVYGSAQEYFDYAARKFSQTNPGSSVRIDRRSEVEFDLTGALNAHSDDYDIYILQVNSSEYGALYDRGFLRPMENEAIQDFVATLYPNFMDAVTLDGNVVALPLEMGCYTIAYNPNVLEELGYTTEDLPASWPEMVRFLANLAPRLEDTDYTAFCADQWVSFVRDDLAELILSAACQKIHETGTGELNTPEMAEMLDTLAGIDFEALGAKASRDDEGDYNDEMYLFDTYGNVNVSQGTTEFVPLMLSLEEGGEPMTPAEITVAVVNPYSRNPQAAEEFLATLIDELPDTTRVNFCRDWEGGVKTENADELIADNDAEIAMIQEGLDNAKDEDEKAGYQQQLEDAQASRDWIMEKFYWDISEDAVKQYQQNEQYVLPARYLGLSISEDLGPILQKCMEGTCDGATALKEMDGKLQMMMQENQ